LRFHGGSIVMSLPPRRTRPEVGAMKPAIIRSVVVLPQPLGPSSITNSPSRTSSETSRTAAVAPKCLDRWSISSRAMASRRRATICTKRSVTIIAALISRIWSTDTAAIVGSIRYSRYWRTVIGSVVRPAPTRNIDISRLPNDTTNPNIAAATIPGRIVGSVTRKNVVSGVAPETLRGLLDAAIEARRGSR
jgi:hypothetical protein